jgi:hypothetical protein
MAARAALGVYCRKGMRRSIAAPTISAATSPACVGRACESNHTRYTNSITSVQYDCLIVAETVKIE